ncbi:uncharacterized protein LOC113865602 [Abrus precatorius]|uniref:Uncharacterized protein LOC113865602 n=1 Tax=Abrus precatorius TaxID=3816 RepID=A0A8B8LJ77_ABRPR|nr:uncharacterized protein LOC113865602 [Abrus precatorius]
MKFFFEFVSCCGSPTKRASEPIAPAPEEESSLVPATISVTVASSRRYCRRQKKAGAADWRPSLGSISEDSVVPPRESPRSGAVASAGRDGKKRSASAAGGGAKIRYRSYSDGYYGASAMSTGMPAFSPAPFMF